MIYKKSDWLCVLLLMLLKSKLFNAQANITNGNPNTGVTSVASRFFDGGRGMGYPNSRDPGRFGNPQSNYPGNPYLPYGNQNNNMQQPQQGFGWSPYTQNPNPGYFPEKPYGNYPGNQGNIYQQNPNNFRPSPSGYDGYDGYDGRFNPNFNNMNQSPNYQRPPYPNTPGDNIVFPGDVNRPYPNEGLPGNQGYPNQPMGIPGNSMQPNGQYPPQGNFQGNPNPGGLMSTYPDDPTLLFPGNDNRNPNGMVNNGNVNIRPNQNNGLIYPGNNIPPNMQYPGDNIHFPTEDSMNQGNGNNYPDSNQVLPGNFNGVSPTSPQLSNNQQINSINGPNANDTAAILGKPVFVPSATTPPGQLVFDSSTASPTQTQCVQDCQTTSEYNPVCGTNNVTYINPGKYNCARNCGIAVNLLRMGRCSPP